MTPADPAAARREHWIRKARSAIDMINAVRGARDKAIRAALDTGMSHREVARAIGTDPLTGRDLISPAHVRRIGLGEGDDEQ